MKCNRIVRYSNFILQWGGLGEGLTLKGMLWKTFRMHGRLQGPPPPNTKKNPFRVMVCLHQKSQYQVVMILLVKVLVVVRR